MFAEDKRTVVTLDAGGTHFRFAAMQGCEFVTDTFELDTHSNDLNLLLEDLFVGFEQTINKLQEKPVAISFAFPGPADYPNGIFPKRLANFPCFEKGVALGPFLENKFQMPVFINNDADLFTYGEALAGILPHINKKILEHGGVKQYHNLVGFILGTGFGIGITSNNKMFIGDNCCSEIYCSPSKWDQNLIAEEGVSQRAVLRYYFEEANDPQAGNYRDSYTIYQIADGTITGDKAAALRAFERFGKAAGYTIAQAACILDGLIVLGGGVSKAAKFYMPALMQELNARMNTLDGQQLPRVPSHIYNLLDNSQFDEFVNGNTKEVQIIGTDKTIKIDTQGRLGIALSHLGTSRATSIGAYCFALHALDSQK